MATDSQKKLTVQKIETVVRIKPEFRDDPSAERKLRELNQRHLAYIQAEKQWNVTQSGVWATRTGADGKKKYIHLYQGHALVVSQDGPIPNPVVTVLASDESGNTISMEITAEAFGLTEVGIVVGALALAAQIALNAEGVEAAVAAAVAILSGEEGAAADITLAGAGGPIGIALAVLAFVVVLALFLAERDMYLNVRYENRSAKKKVRLVDCWTWNLPNIAAADLQPLHEVAGLDAYDTALYQHHNDRKTEGIGLSLLFQSDDGYANVCIRNDIHKDPIFGVATGTTLVSPKDFYYNIPNSPLNQDCAWGSLVIKSSFDPKQFNNYQFDGIVSFNDK